MIDYDKLREAHELADKWAKTEKKAIGIWVWLWSDKQAPSYEYANFGDRPSGFLTLDDLITKLRELTEPEPKYKEGQLVWFAGCCDIRNGLIKSIRNDSYLIDLNEDVSYCEKEQDLYPTKSALIAAQIKYWSEMREPQKPTLCPKCKESRVADGMCWSIGCDYKEPEYCNVSGAKLGKPEECKCNTEYFHAKDGRCVCCNKPYKEICKHESDGKVYESWDFGRFTNEQRYNGHVFAA